MGPHWDRDELKEIIRLLDVSEAQNFEFDAHTNDRLIKIFEVAKEHYYSRIMNMVDYYRDTDKMIMACNKKGPSVRNNLLIITGGPRKKVA